MNDEIDRCSFAESQQAQQSQASDITTENSDARKVAIFWDYENLAVPSGADASEACQAVSRAVSKYGRITDRRIYFNYVDSRQLIPWDKFDSSGFDLVNTPRRGNQKETLDKKLIADLWAFAWDNSKANADRPVSCQMPCIVLLTGDGDFAYTLNKLRDRGIFCVVIHGFESSVSSILLDSASVCLNFSSEVLRTQKAKSRSREHALLPGQDMIGTQSVVFDEETTGSWTEGVETDLEVTATPAQIVDGSSVLEDAKEVCKLISICQGSTLDGWVRATTLGVEFRIATKTQPRNSSSKARFRAARDAAVARGWAVKGWLNKANGNNNIETLTGASVPLPGEKGEDYLRLTKIGNLLQSDIPPVETPVAAVKPSLCQEAKRILKIVLDISTSKNNVTLKDEYGSPHNWVEGAHISHLYQTAFGSERLANDVKKACNEARQFATSNGWIDHGCRILNLNKSNVKAVMPRGTVPPNASLGESYLRLTESGLSFLRGRYQQDRKVNRRQSLEKISTTNLARGASPTAEQDAEDADAQKDEQAAMVNRNSFRDPKVVRDTIAGTPEPKTEPLVTTGFEEMKPARNASVSTEESNAMTQTAEANLEDIAAHKTVDGAAKRILRIVQEAPFSQDNSTLEYENRKPCNWVSGSYVGLAFRTDVGSAKTVQEPKPTYAEAKRFAVTNGWIETGMKILHLSKPNAKVIMSKATVSPGTSVGEDYLRLTERGLSILTDVPPEHCETYHSSGLEHDSKADPCRTAETGGRPRAGLGVEQPAEVNRTSFRDARIVCDIIASASIEKSWLAVCENGEPYSWLEATRVRKIFREKPGVSFEPEIAKTRFSNATSLAVQFGWLERGWRLLRSSESVGYKTIVTDESTPTAAPRGESYLRLTKTGASIVKGKPQQDNLLSRSLFIKNVPRSVSASDLVRYLQSNHNCKILFAKEKEVHPGKGAFWFIRVVVECESEASMLLHLSKEARLVLQGRQLEVAHDKHPLSQNDLKSDSIHCQHGTLGTTATTADKKHSTNVQVRLFVKNVSSSTSIERLVVFLESVLSCTIVRAKRETERVSYSSRYYFARLELLNPEDARKFITTPTLQLDGRKLEFSYDRFAVDTIRGDCRMFPEIFYDRAQKIQASNSMPAASSSVKVDSQTAMPSSERQSEGDSIASLDPIPNLSTQQMDVPQVHDAESNNNLPEQQQGGPIRASEPGEPRAQPKSDTGALHSVLRKFGFWSE